MSYLTILLLSGLAIAIAMLRRHLRRRTALRTALAATRDATIQTHPPRLAVGVRAEIASAAFARDRLCRVDGFVAESTLGVLQRECLAAGHLAERSYIPSHKQGGTLSYEAIHRQAPACLGLYHSAALREWLSALVGTPLAVAADHDQSACSLLYYDRVGDHIGWHYDHNFYRGRHFTVLLALLNRAAAGGPSAARLQVRRDGAVLDVDTQANTLVVFEGAQVRHRATAAADGDRRILLSMTFCTDPRLGVVSEIVRRCKDVAYYGPRALID